MSLVSKAKDYIADGDIFQVVLSQRWEAEFEGQANIPLPGASANQPLALHVLLQFREISDHRSKSGNLGSGVRTEGHDTAIGRQPPSRRDA